MSCPANMLCIPLVPLAMKSFCACLPMSPPPFKPFISLRSLLACLPIFFELSATLSNIVAIFPKSGIIWLTIGAANNPNTPIKEVILSFKNEIIGNQRNKFKIYEDDLTDVYNSRTFCLFEDIEQIKKNGLARGGSLENAIVVKDKEILNTEGLRNEKEFVNHKILDCVGDLYTSGYRIIGSVICSQGGHYLTNQLLRKVFSDNSNFSIIEIQEKNLPHTLINRSLLRSIA